MQTKAMHAGWIHDPERADPARPHTPWADHGAESDDILFAESERRARREAGRVDDADGPSDRHAPPKRSRSRSRILGRMRSYKKTTGSE